MNGHQQIRGSCSAVSNYYFLQGGLLLCLISKDKIGLSVYIETHRCGSEEGFVCVWVCVCVRDFEGVWS